MAQLYPSWLEIPVNDLERAIAFYKAVFELTETPIYDDYPPARIAVLRPSDKSKQTPGVSLVQSPIHTPSPHGSLINFHVGDHMVLERALQVALTKAGVITQSVTEIDEGVRYVVLLDCEGNAIALSSYEHTDENDHGVNNVE